VPSEAETAAPAGSEVVAEEPMSEVAAEATRDEGEESAAITETSDEEAATAETANETAAETEEA
jgi:hypothetical protein